MADSLPPRDLPQVSDSVDPAIRRPLSRVIEEVQRLLEFRGDPLDAALTLRKAIARGLVDSVGRGLSGNVTYVNTFPTSTGGGSDEPDLTPPPTVTGLSVTAGFTQVLVTFDAPTYTQGHGNLQTNIYASRKAATDATIPVFADAVLVFSAPGALNVVSIPSELNTRWHVWAKYKTVDGVESTTAAGGANGFNVSGVYPTTGQDIAQLLDVLSGSITTSQLATALNTRIDLIDAADTVAGSVSAKVKAEADARAAAITLARSDFAAADAATLASANSYVTTYAYSKATVDGALAAQDTTLRAAFAAADATTLATANAFTYSRSTIDAAIASSASTLTASYGAAISAAVGIEASARAALDGAVQALYTVRTQVSSGGSTMVGGFGLAATATAGGGATIDFGVIANRFYVGAPNDGSAPGIADALPFIIQATPTTINGVAVPAGVYIRDAFILNGSITNAKIGNAAIDDAKVANLSAAKLTVGDGTVGGNLKSTSYTAGSGVTPGTGWLLTPAGNVYLNNAVVYGTVYATNGVFSGSLSGASITGATGNFTGTLSGANITGATGTFSGSLNINSGGSNRMEMTDTRIRIFNAGVERIRIGDLSPP